MGSSDNFCLRWNDFESNISTSFRELREDSEFFDVTLCCDNGTDVVQAHKVILAACSPLFRKILARQKNQQNPFLYLKGIRLKELQAVLNFMYHGEVNVAQDCLNNFLAVAEELAVKGLTTDGKPGSGSDTSALERKKAVAKRKSLPPPSSQTSSAAKKPKPADQVVDVDPQEEDIKIKPEPEPSGSGTSAAAVMAEADIGDDSYAGDADDNGDFGGEDFEGFDSYGDGGDFDDSMGAGGSGAAADGKGETVESFLVRGANLCWCNACGHSGPRGKPSDIARHIEARHLNLEYQCKICQFTTRTKLTLTRHLRKYHLKQYQDPKQMKLALKDMLNFHLS